MGEGELGPHLTQCGHAGRRPTYAKFHLDPSNRLADVTDWTGKTDRHRQDNGPIA